MPSRTSDNKSNAPHGYESKLHGIGIKTYGSVAVRYRKNLDRIVEKTGDYQNAAIPALISWVVDNDELFDCFITNYLDTVVAARREVDIEATLRIFPELERKRVL